MKKLRFLSIVLMLSMLFSFSAYAISPEEASQAVSADLTPADTVAYDTYYSDDTEPYYFNQ